MSTTSVIIEHLICGIQTLLWIILLTLTVVGIDWINIEILSKFSTYIAAIILVFAYPVGIFMDELADFIFTNESKKIRKETFCNEGLLTAELHNSTFTTAFFLLRSSDNDFFKEYFNYLRTRVRIARSSTVNFLFITITIFLFSLIQLNLSYTALILEIATGLLLSVLAYFSWRRFITLFSKKIAQAHMQEKANNSKLRNDSNNIEVIHED